VIQAKAIFHGSVQGVFFRKCVFNHAKKFSVNGFVKNVENSRVEALFQGEKLEIEKLIDVIKENPGSAHISKIELEYQDVEKKYSGFVIEY
jgi:acylphosphatase